MAGNPKKRARRAAEQAEASAARVMQAADEIRAVIPHTAHPPVETLGQHARTPAPARKPPPIYQHLHEGAPARAAAERREAADYDELTAQLSPGVTVRLIRTRPSWAAGWIEDLDLDTGDVSELFEHLRAEHGGQVYSVQLIGRDNRILYKARVPIAGPVRRDGKPINREQWEGTATDAPTSTRTREREPAAANSGGLDPLRLVEMFLTMQERSSGQITEAIREMQRMQTKQTEGLIAAVMDQRSNERTSTSLAGQLREVAAVTQQVDEIRAAIVASAPQQQQQAEPVDPIRSMTADILKAAMTNEINKRSAQPQPSAAAPRPAAPRRPAPPPRQANGTPRPPTVEPLTPKQRTNDLQ